MSIIKKLAKELNQIPDENLLQNINQIIRDYIYDWHEGYELFERRAEQNGILIVSLLNCQHDMQRHNIAIFRELLLCLTPAKLQYLFNITGLLQAKSAIIIALATHKSKVPFWRIDVEQAVHKLLIPERGQQDKIKQFATLIVNIITLPLDGCLQTSTLSFLLQKILCNACTSSRNSVLISALNCLSDNERPSLLGLLTNEQCDKIFQAVKSRIKKSQTVELQPLKRTLRHYMEARKAQLTAEYDGMVMLPIFL